MDRLAERGWIVKETDAKDKRHLRIYPSEKARALRPELEAGRTRANEEILGDLNLEEKVLLKRLPRDVQG